MTTGTKQTTPRPPINTLRVEAWRDLQTWHTSQTRGLQERRIRWAHGLSASHAALIAALVYDEAAQ